jgi:hypothetical protein
MDVEKVEDAQPDWLQLASARWKNADVYSYGPGPAGSFAVLQHCFHTTIPLCRTLEEAVAVFGQRCTNSCDSRHSLVQLHYDADTGKVRVKTLLRNPGLRAFIERHGEVAV